MRRKLVVILASILLIVMAGCSQSAPVAAPTAEVAAPAAATVLTVAGNGETVSLSMADLQALPVSEGQAGTLSSTGKITVPAKFTGVSLKDLADLVGGMDESMGLLVTAEDGYSITYSYDQVMNGDFITYDPSDGLETKIDDPLTPIIAYAIDGQALDEKSDGTLRMVILSPKNNQITDGHWAVKWVTSLEVKPLAAEWVLHLEGVLSEDIDRGSFEAGSSPSCHYASWVDADGHEWEGIPLWYLVGRVDDENKHENHAYNDQLADQGYTIQMIASDGYEVDLDSQSVKFNDNMIVAYLMDGEPLPEKDFPLKLVGSEVSKGQNIGAISEIKLDFSKMSEPSAEVTPESSEAVSETVDTTPVEGDLVVVGSVGKALGFAKDELKSSEMVTVTAQNKKGESVEYTGIPLSAILEMAKPISAVDTVTFTASDDYSISLPYADVKSCKDCLVAFDDDDSLKTIMPGMDGANWVKSLVQIKFEAPAAAAPAPAGEGDLVINGKVEQPVALAYDQISAMDMITITAQNKKGDQVEYTGVKITDLFDMAKPAADAKTVVLTADDGFAAEVALSDLKACDQCILRFNDGGTLSATFPGLDTETWVKGVVQIEFK